MKKDIQVPKVENVFIAAVIELNEQFRKDEWNAYLLNDNDFPLEEAIVVCKGFEGRKVTSTMRHHVKLLPKKSFVKIEWLPPELLKLNNEFSVSFFANGKLFHRKFLFKKNSVTQRNCTELPLWMQEEGVLAD